MFDIRHHAFRIDVRAHARTHASTRPAIRKQASTNHPARNTSVSAAAYPLEDAARCDTLSLSTGTILFYTLPPSPTLCSSISISLALTLSLFSLTLSLSHSLFFSLAAAASHPPGCDLYATADGAGPRGPRLRCRMSVICTICITLVASPPPRARPGAGARIMITASLSSWAGVDWHRRGRLRQVGGLCVSVQCPTSNDQQSNGPSAQQDAAGRRTS